MHSARAAADLATLQLTVHPDKRYIGKTEKGFDFPGYRFSQIWNEVNHHLTR
ncbi:MAG: hypothetical protein WCO67_13380 [Betaproteobacteria bacterium]